ncbi:MAG: hypothetical protein JHC59_01360 [Ilumatobacteraceae bacterium]|nr:hypothetical protein [Ilumatobacteraceae bacterium]
MDHKRASKFSFERQVATLSCVIGLMVLPGCSTSVVSIVASSSTVLSAPAGGPKSPSCGIYEVTQAEVIAGQKFSKGKYQINTFGITCDEVMGDSGLFSQFLKLDDNAELPKPWSYLEGAVGAPKFVSAPAVGFRVQRISD